MRHIQPFGLLAAVLASLNHASAADVTGKWKTEFDTPIGHIKYTYDFKADGAALTGTAHRESPAGKNDIELKDGKIDGDDISFTELLHRPDQDITIVYKGKIAGDEIKFNRKVGDFAAADIVAKRAPDDAPTAPIDGAVSVNGKWRSEFDTQIGKQKYLFTLSAEGGKVTGKAHAEFNAPNDGGPQKVDTTLEDGKLDGAKISFTENMKLGDMTLNITYNGTVSGDQIKLTRKVGDFATEELTANREK
jgi:hypothetical protein